MTEENLYFLSNEVVRELTVMPEKHGPLHYFGNKNSFTYRHWWWGAPGPRPELLSGQVILRGMRVSVRSWELFRWKYPKETVVAVSLIYTRTYTLQQLTCQRGGSDTGLEQRTRQSPCPAGVYPLVGEANKTQINKTMSESDRYSEVSHSMARSQGKEGKMQEVRLARKCGTRSSRTMTKTWDFILSMMGSHGRIVRKGVTWWDYVLKGSPWLLGWQ